MAMTDAIIGIFVVILLAAVLLPIAFTLIFGTNTTTWDDSTATIFALLPIIAIVGVIILLVSAYYLSRA